MAGSKTDAFETQVLNTARATTLTSWTPFVGLVTVITNGETSSVTEVATGSYARQAVTFGAPSSGTMTNSALITFPTASASWGTVVGAIVCTASSAGQINYYSDLTANETVNSGNVVTIAIGALSVSEG